MKHTFWLALSAFTLFSCGGISTQTDSSIVENSSELSENSQKEADSTGFSDISESSFASSISSVEEESLSEESAGNESSASSEEEGLDRLDPMDEPYIGKQFYLNHIGDIYSSWNSYRGKGVTVAVIDVGFDPYHEEFYDSKGNSRVSENSAYFVEDSAGKVATYKGVDKVVISEESHGTFCAGVVGAAINGKGIAGIAPEATLLLLRTDSKPRSIAEAFEYAADNGARVITISIGSYYNYVGDLVNDGSDLSTVFDSSLKYCHDKGVVICSAGGNGGLSGTPTEYTFPGACQYVIGAGGLAANSSTEIWDGSSYNSSKKYEFCDVFAPANLMFGCCNYQGKKYDGGWNGTSFASPIVAGAAALYFEKYPNKGCDDFEADLYASCDPILPSENTAHGRIDIGQLLDVSAPEKITVKVKADWSYADCYMWNSRLGTELSSWPGKRMSKSDGLFVFEGNNLPYDTLIINYESGGKSHKSADLHLSSFASGHYYDLTAADSYPYLVGQYA